MCDAPIVSVSGFSPGIHETKHYMAESGIIPRLNTIEQSYLDTSERYMEKTDQIDTMEQNIGVLKSVVQNHSDRLNRLSV